jgi:hypothetical protein
MNELITAKMAAASGLMNIGEQKVKFLVSVSFNRDH